MNFRIVSPYPVNVKQNQEVISRLKNYTQPEYTHIEPLYEIPVFGELDVDKFLQEQRLKKPASHLNGTNHAKVSSNNLATVDAEIEANTKLYVELADLLPQNRQQQQATVILQNCPALRRNAMEKVLRDIVSILPVKGQFKWTELTERDFGESSNIFVRFSNLDLAELFCGVLPQFKNAFGVEVTANLEGKAVDVDDDLLRQTVSSVSSVIVNKTNHGRSSMKTGTEDLDEVMQHYSTYTVDNADLVDIPLELRDKIVKEIIKFRTRVLTIERNRRKDELEIERRKAKATLTSIFQDIKDPSSTTDTQDQDGMDVADDDDVDDEQQLDFDMADDEYIKKMNQDETRKEQEAYERALKKMKRLEQTEITSLLLQLETEQNYELELMDNKLTYLEEFKSFVDFDNPRVNPILSSHLQLYYNDHSEYLRVRNLERSKEEELDAADAEMESLETHDESMMNIQAKLPSPQQVKDLGHIIVLELSKDKLLALKEKIENLIEEYLGVKEELLVDFVYDFLISNNLSQRDVLTAELQETLDEDSNVVVEELYKFLTQR